MGIEKLTKFSQDTYYQTEFNGDLRQDELVCLIKLLENIDLNVYGANNAILKAQLNRKLRDFSEK